MASVIADTHAILWYLREPSRLSPAARTALEHAVASGGLIYFSTISIVEICYLVEKARRSVADSEEVLRVLDTPGSELVALSLDLNIARAMPQIPRDLVPDMPDRIIAATALHLSLPLITRDAKIRTAPVRTIW
jgi:PIN domain nuclease of toxin-antitoxin system